MKYLKYPSGKIYHSKGTRYVGIACIYILINYISRLLSFSIQSKSILSHTFAFSLFFQVPPANLVCGGQQLCLTADCMLPDSYKQRHEGRQQCQQSCCLLPFIWNGANKTELGLMQASPEGSSAILQTTQLKFTWLHVAWET